MFKRSSIRKFIFGIFLSGLVFLTNPIEGYCYRGYGITKTMPNQVTLPYSYDAFLPDVLNGTPNSFGWGARYRLPYELPISTSNSGTYSFTYNLSMIIHNSFYNVKCLGSFHCIFYFYYYDVNNNLTYQLFESFKDVSIDGTSDGHIIDFNIPLTFQGSPAYIDFDLICEDNLRLLPFVFYPSEELTIDLNASNSGSSSYVATMSGSTIGTTGSYTGSVSNEYGQYFESYPGSSSGTWSQNGQGSESGSLSIQGVTFTGSVNMQSSSSDYSGTITPEDADPSGSYFVFGIVTSTTDFKIVYDPLMNESLDNIESTNSSINSNTSTIINIDNSINSHTSAIESNTSTLVDQFQDFFDYVAPNTQSFNVDKSSTDSMIQSASSIQTGYFDSFSSAVNDTGLDSFDWSEYNPQLTYVSTLLTSVYNTFPNKVKYAIYFILFLGFFAVLINAVSYIVRKRG